MRLLVRLMAQATTAGQDVEWTHGVLPVTRDAFLGAETPEPYVDEQRWYLADAGMFPTDADAGPRGRTFEYDVRTARRIADQETVLLHVFRNVHSANSVTYHVATRCLVMLP